MNKLTDALTFIFKEKNWVVKFLIPFSIILIIFVLSSISALSELSNPSFINSADYYNYAFAIGTIISLMVTLLLCILIIPLVILESWYYYESAQSGIQKRETVNLFGSNFGDNIKRSFKYLLVSLIYGTIILSIGSIVLVVLGLTIAILESGSTSFRQFGILGMFQSGGPEVILLILISCFILVGFTIFFTLAFLTIIPSYLRLFATNTFSEAFKIKDNWRLVMKYKAEFLGILVVSLLGALTISLISGGFDFTAGIFASVPVLSFLVTLFGSIISAILTTYYSFFVLPRFMGLVYRDIIHKEPSLSYIPVK